MERVQAMAPLQLTHPAVQRGRPLQQAPSPHPLPASSRHPLRSPVAPSAHLCAPLHPLRTLPAPAPNLHRRCLSSHLAVRVGRRRCWGPLIEAATATAIGKEARGRTQATSTTGTRAGTRGTGRGRGWRAATSMAAAAPGGTARMTCAPLDEPTRLPDPCRNPDPHPCRRHPHPLVSALARPLPLLLPPSPSPFPHPRLRQVRLRRRQRPRL